MKKPYIICHMMTSIDGRIDCAMTSKLRGVNEYYQTLEELDVPTTVSGRVTAELEMAEPGEYVPKDTTAYRKEEFSKKTEAAGYEIVVDSRGRLLWPRSEGEAKPYLILTAIGVAKEYLEEENGDLTEALHKSGTGER